MSKDTKSSKKGGDQLVTRSYLGEQFEQFEQKIDAKFDNLVGILKQQFDNIDGRFVGLETRMTGLESHMTHLEVRMTGLEGRMDSLEGRIGSLEGKVEGIHSFLYRQVEQSDQRFMETNSTVRLHDQWIRKASRKVGVPYPFAASRHR